MTHEDGEDTEKASVELRRVGSNTFRSFAVTINNENTIK